MGETQPPRLEQLDHLSFALTPDRGTPSGVHRGNQAGWIQAVNVQGVVFENWDHYAIGPTMVGTEPGIIVAVWNDDPDDWNEPHGQRWTFLAPAADETIGGQINTRQTLAVYGPSAWTDNWADVTEVIRRPWSEWPTPPVAVRHGVWVTDESYTTARSVRSGRRWDEWVT